MMNLVKRFRKDEEGATAIEYGLLAALIGVAIVVGATQVGGAVNDKFKGVASCLASNSNAGDPGYDPAATATAECQ